MALDTRALHVSPGATATDRGRRQDNRWAALLVGASIVGLVVLTTGMWFASLPLLGCVELILVIALGTGVAVLRRKDSGADPFPAPPRASRLATDVGRTPSRESLPRGLGIEAGAGRGPQTFADHTADRVDRGP